MHGSRTRVSIVNEAGAYLPTVENNDKRGRDQFMIESYWREGMGRCVAKDERLLLTNWSAIMCQRARWN